METERRQRAAVLIWTAWALMTGFWVGAWLFVGGPLWLLPLFWLYVGFWLRRNWRTVSPPIERIVGPGRPPKTPRPLTPAEEEAAYQERRWQEREAEAWKAAEAELRGLGEDGAAEMVSRRD